ncbi:hypothetical protein F442_03440 [Phytophthora nicotianae P10297]|uniref:Uncharacterized protein n=1 Tax=Phytophthora nicotianae P10297 TaxID=1317064 RepID=W2ZYU8_PHYNI|nr:hypothetical protein F442_03440 [Phytophthora nicotianae P10297]
MAPLRLACSGNSARHCDCASSDTSQKGSVRVTSDVDIYWNQDDAGSDYFAQHAYLGIEHPRTVKFVFEA